MKILFFRFFSFIVCFSELIIIFKCCNEYTERMNNTTANDADTKFPNMASSSRLLWSSSKNPRVVRAPRNFGGKDRHTKVTTMRGVRDRRIRLSAATAIQLFDLQEKLSLRQPSKAVDWLLGVAKTNIDNLPTLPGFTTQIATATVNHIVAEYHSPFSEVPPNTSTYDNSNSIWDPPNYLSLSQFGGGLWFPQTYDEEKSRISLMTTSPNSQQLYSCPSANTTTLPSIFPAFFSHNHNIPFSSTPSMEIDDRSRQFNILED